MFGIPNCVPEYFREQQEREEREWELKMERQDAYERNRAYIEKRQSEGCAIVTFHPDECWKCPHGEEAGQTFEDDDIPTVICSNWRNCEVFKKDMSESFPNVSWEEIVSWFEADIKGE